MSHPWYINNRCKLCKRRESIWNHGFEGKRMFKLFYCMTSRQDVPFLCLVSSAYFIYSAVYLGASKIKALYPWKIRSWDEVQMHTKQGCRRLSMCWLRKNILGCSEWYWSSGIEQYWAKVRHCPGATPSFTNRSCNGLIPLAFSTKKVLTVRLGAACLMSWSSSSV